MSKEACAELIGRRHAGFNLAQKQFRVELADALQISEHDVLLASQWLRHALREDLGNVVVDDVV